MKLVVAATGASGAIYTQRLLDNLFEHDVHFISTRHAREVQTLELAGGLKVPSGVTRYEEDGSMFVPFVSGSALFDAMVIIPASMGTIGRIANGVSDTTIARAADVFLKERRKLILVPREAPYNLIHLRNMAALTEAGATIIPASPSFYSGSQTVTDLVDTIVARVLDHLSVTHNLGKRWQNAP
ncbi:MAG: UbiX family flavin prenyltransferase [Verrucomicrobia bacterium]|nr:UbiX family flavin prenyltransferase [Verrucomicrobiota bacterium]